MDEILTEKWFLDRNYGGTFHLIEELSNNGLVESDGESWHLTYVLTLLGKKILKQNSQVAKLVDA
jgi:predicted transcriptional regulator